MDLQLLRERRCVSSSLSKQEQKNVVKDFQNGLRKYKICVKYKISETGMNRILQGHRGKRPSMFKKKEKTAKPQKKSKVLLTDKDRIKELEKELSKKEKQIHDYQSQISAVKGFLGKF